MSEQKPWEVVEPKEKEVHNEEIKAGDIVEHKLDYVPVSLFVKSVSDDRIYCVYWVNDHFVERYFDKKELIKQ